MATTFIHNGNTYTIIEGTDEVQLNQLGGLDREIYIPKYAMFQNKRYTVTEIVCPRREEKEYINVETDKRKKKRFEYVSRGWFDYNLAGYNIDTAVKNKVPREYVEEKCRVVRSINIPDSVRLIGERSFIAFVGLQHVEMPESIIEIGDYAFNGCENLKILQLPSKLEKIGRLVFCRSQIQSVSIPDSVKEISYAASRGCDFLTKVTINSDPFEIMIGSEAFPPKATITYLKNTKVPKVQKKENKTEKTKPAETAESVKMVSKQELNESGSEFQWGDKVWEPIKACLATNDIVLKAPKTNQNWIVFKLKSIDAQIVLAYNLGKNIATVQLETSSGEVVKYKISSKIAQTKESHVIRTAEVEQSKRNKDKWVWAVRKNINKNSPEIIKWYTDVMIDIYQAIED